MTDRQINALAAFICEGRSDFDNPGVVAALRATRDRYDPWQLAMAMIRRAADSSNLTPRLQAFDFDGQVGCRRHPGAPIRTDGTCGWCFADAHGVEYEPRRGEPSHPLRAAVERETTDA